MDLSVLSWIKIIFLFGFTLHNLEEAVWLPRWSHYAERFHQPVPSNSFIFAVIIVTLLGYLVTVLDFLAGSSGNFFNYLYLGFVGMMGLNAFFPHLLATIALKKYSPGLVTGLFFNLPVALLLIIGYIQNGFAILFVLGTIVIISSLTLFSLKYLFRLGAILINFSE